jgi:sodium-dependent phosphate transporter
VGIVAGLSFLGSKVMKTLGKELTPISPSKGFSIELGSALTVLISTIGNFPVSSTHCKAYIFE